MSCIFCKIIAKEIPSEVVLEDEQFLSFYDISPQAPKHILVIPKKHINSFEEVDAKTMGDMTLFIQKITKHLGLDKDGYRLISNVGTHGCQEVPHLHFHILAGEKIGALRS